MDAIVLDRIRRSRAIADSLWELCDFALAKETPPSWFALESGELSEVIARDGAGGRFVLLGITASEEKALLYVSSEGQAGVIAGDLSEGLQLMVALPYWRDCLKFSGKGNLECMRKARDHLEEKLRQQRPHIEALRAKLYQGLKLQPPTSPVDMLHRAVTEGKGVKVVSPKDRWPFEELFNEFKF